MLGRPIAEVMVPLPIAEEVLSPCKAMCRKKQETVTPATIVFRIRPILSLASCLGRRRNTGLSLVVVFRLTEVAAAPLF